MNFEKALSKWIPIIVSVIFAVIDGVAENKRDDHVDDLERRLLLLESKSKKKT